MTISNTKRFRGGQVLEHEDMNDGISTPIEDLAGRNGVIELEDSLVIQTSTGSYYLQFPQGTTAQRPTNPQVGYSRFNTTIDEIEWWNGTEWDNTDRPATTIITYAQLSSNGDIGTGSTQIARGNHGH